MFLKRKKTKLSKEVAALDKAFKTWIRLSKSNKDGVCFCITCNKPKMWNNCDSGHFMTSGFFPTRWEPDNVWPQCVQCNRFKEGLHYEMGKAIDKRMGQGTADKMVLKAKTGQRLDKFQMAELAKHYRKLCKELKEEKGL
jgi:hypothetical protein